MAVNVSARAITYASGVQKRSGTGALYNKTKAGGIVIDTADSSLLKYNQAGTVRKVVSENGTQTLTNKTLTSPVISGTPNINTVKSAFSLVQVAGGYAADTYLAGSGIAMPAGGFVAGARYSCIFDMVKTAAGTAQFTVTLRIGVAGATTDASILSFAFAAGTAAIDTGMFEVFAHFRTVGATTTAVVVGTAFCSHALAATGLISTGASGIGQLTVVSSGFDSTVAGTTIGLSVNGGTSFSGTNTIVESELHSF